MKDILEKMFHILGIIFFVIVLYLLLSIGGFFSGFGQAWKAMEQSGH